MNKEWLNQFFPDPEGLGYYKNSTENNTEAEFLYLGHVHVYREFKVSKDSLEYTVYFKQDGENHRIDFELFLPFIEGKSTEWVNGYIEGFATSEAPQVIEWEKEMREGARTVNEVRND